MVKLQNATRKLDIPTRTGIFCLRSPGTRTGAGATKSSKAMKMAKKAIARTRGTITVQELHCSEHVK
jgi:hypothetical protein